MNGMDTGITITTQTYNRADELRQTLRSLSKIDTRGVPAYEVLVVDNNSQDDTPEVVEEFSSAFNGCLRYVREAQQGLSHARNRAIAEARYDIVAFLDDDVEVDKEWLRNLAAAYDSGDYAAIGGSAHLVYSCQKPRWLEGRAERFLSKVDCGPFRRLVEPDEICGVNFSVKKEWLTRVGSFRTDLGRMGAVLLGSEETDLLERVAQAGGTVLYEPGAVVGHRVSPSRLQRRWFWGRCYWGGRGQARSLPESQITCYEVLRATWHVALMGARILRSALSYGPRSSEPFFHTQNLASCLGFWVEFLGRLSKRIRPSESPQAPVESLTS